MAEGQTEGKGIHLKCNACGATYELDGCDGKLHYEQTPNSSYSVNADYYWYEIGDIVSIGTNECLYYCFPKGRDIVAKTRIAAEELYKLLKESKKQGKKKLNKLRTIFEMRRL